MEESPYRTSCFLSPHSATTTDDGVVYNPKSVVSVLVIDAAWTLFSMSLRQARTYELRFSNPPTVMVAMATATIV
jgi:hypothetical protein